MIKNNIKNLVLSSAFLAMGFILPFFTGQIPQIGMALLPMHIPVFLCAFICPWQYSVIMASILPIMRSVIFGVPNMYPEAVAISFELATYAMTTGILYRLLSRYRVLSIYISLIASMIFGRIMRGAVQLFLLGLKDVPYSFEMFFSSTIIAGIPGIVLQIILIPAVMMTLSRTNFVQTRNEENIEFKFHINNRKEKL